jgi:hypothetical protein
MAMLIVHFPLQYDDVSATTLPFQLRSCLSHPWFLRTSKDQVLKNGSGAVDGHHRVSPIAGWAIPDCMENPSIDKHDKGKKNWKKMTFGISHLRLMINLGLPPNSGTHILKL